LNKTSKILIFFILALSFLVSCKSSEDLFEKAPPGTVYSGDSIYMDAMPVRTKEYVDFLNSIKGFYSKAFVDSIKKLPNYGLTRTHVDSIMNHFKGDSNMYKKMLPRVWMTYSSYDKRYEPDYRLSNPQFFNYPIVNITPEQAKKYCEWRTTMVLLYYATISNTEKERQNYPLNLQYRIVERKAWEKTLSIYFRDLGVNKHAGKYENANKPKAYEINRKKYFYYDATNAAELLDKDIVSLDFEWTKSVGLGNISYVRFKQPEDWITFRCMCEILPPKK